MAYLGPGSAGHYVKMVHNGIEYGLMQLIAESYALLKQGLGLDNERLAEVYAEWQAGELESYLLEITAAIFRRRDDKTSGFLVDLILGEAGQLGTGMWTSQSAMDLHVPVPNIDIAVSMRNLSALEDERAAARQVLGLPGVAGAAGAGGTAAGTAAAARARPHRSTRCAMLSLPARSSPTPRASRSFSERRPPRATTWPCTTWPRSGGEAASSAPLCSATSGRPSSGSRICPTCCSTPELSREVTARRPLSRRPLRPGWPRGSRFRAWLTALSYLDGYLADWLPTNLIQAQRDYFGAHTYRRIDQEGVFHTDWSS